MLSFKTKYDLHKCLTDAVRLQLLENKEIFITRKRILNLFNIKWQNLQKYEKKYNSIIPVKIGTTVFYKKEAILNFIKDKKNMGNKITLDENTIAQIVKEVKKLVRRIVKENDQQYLTPQQLCEYLHVSYTTLLKFMKEEKEFPKGVLMAGISRYKKLYSKKAIDSWIESKYENNISKITTEKKEKIKK